MYLPLTDILTCPRCGPTTGLILLAERLEGRRVQSGRLGCPACRSSFPIDDGVARLRTEEPDVPHEPEAPADIELKTAAGFGTPDLAGYVLLVGYDDATIARLSSLLRVAHFVVDGVVGIGNERTSVMEFNASIPIATNALAGIGLVNPNEVRLLDAYRILRPAARMVVFGADVRGIESSHGAKVLLSSADVSVVEKVLR